MDQKEQPGLDELITPEEENISDLRAAQVPGMGFGEPLPEKVEVEGNDVEVHDVIWRCIHNKEFSEQEKKRFIELIRMLETKEKLDEESLKKASLTREEARKLFHESEKMLMRFEIPHIAL